MTMEEIYLRCLCVHNFVLNQITFVANQKLANTVVCISVDFIQPLFDIVEALHFGNIIHNLLQFRSNGNMWVSECKNAPIS